MTPDESRPQPNIWPAYRVFAAFLLFVVVACGAAIVFLPIGWQLNRFVVWLYYFVAGHVGGRVLTIPVFDFLLNMALFAVPIFLAAIVWPRVRWWQWTLLGLAASLTVEVIQYLYLPRDASALDILANAFGAACGAATARLLSGRPPTSSPVHK